MTLNGLPYSINNWNLRNNYENSFYYIVYRLFRVVLIWKGKLEEKSRFSASENVDNVLDDESGKSALSEVFESRVDDVSVSEYESEMKEGNKLKVLSWTELKEINLLGSFCNIQWSLT